MYEICTLPTGICTGVHVRCMHVAVPSRAVIPPFMLRGSLQPWLQQQQLHRHIHSREVAGAHKLQLQVGFRRVERYPLTAPLSVKV